MGADTKGGISLRQKKRFTEHEWILLEEKFNDLLPPILGYAEFLQMQLGPESELSQDAHEIELAAGQLQALFQEIFSHHGPVGGKDRAATNVRQGYLPSKLPEKFGER
jgi:hypothetical protein